MDAASGRLTNNITKELSLHALDTHTVRFHRPGNTLQSF